MLGVEDACAWSLYGHAASIAPNPLTELGIPTAISLSANGSVDVRHVIGAVPTPPGWTTAADVRAGDGVLTVTDTAGKALALPFDHHFLAQGV